MLPRAVLGFEQTTQLRSRLAVDTALRRLLGFESNRPLPSEATFSRAFAEFARIGLPAKAHEALIRKHLGTSLIGHIARDSTAIHDRERSQYSAAETGGFWDEHKVLAGEDRGDTLHTQGNAVPGQIGALDSIWLFDTRKDYVVATNRPVRIIAQGRDASATVDTALLGSPGFQNDGDNETTGIHVSDGDARIDGILGAKIPRPFRNDWRVFYTQQHGENVTYEIIRAARGGSGAQRGDLDSD